MPSKKTAEGSLQDRQAVLLPGMVHVAHSGAHCSQIAVIGLTSCCGHEQTQVPLTSMKPLQQEVQALGLNGA